MWECAEGERCEAGELAEVGQGMGELVGVEGDGTAGGIASGGEGLAAAAEVEEGLVAGVVVAVGAHKEEDGVEDVGW